jgi:hypothetical protein
MQQHKLWSRHLSEEDATVSDEPDVVEADGATVEEIVDKPAARVPCRRWTTLTPEEQAEAKLEEVPGEETTAESVGEIPIEVEAAVSEEPAIVETKETIVEETVDIPAEESPVRRRCCCSRRGYSRIGERTLLGKRWSNQSKRHLLMKKQQHQKSRL